MPNISSIVWCGTVALLLVTPAIEAATLIPAGAVWKYSDTGVNLGTIWRSPDFDDGLWSGGAAQLGYGDGDEATTNQFGLDPNNKHLTTYYRHSFQVQDLGSISNLQMRLLRDDGAVVYINGAEIFRSNLPVGTIGFQTRAQADAVMDGNTWIAVDLPVSGLREGQNVVAVEVHQITPSSTDLSFDFELLANIPPFRPQPAMTQWSAALGGSGHYYEAVVVPGGASWNTASVGATNRGGYLATITSQAENGLIYDLIKSNPAIWHDRSGDAYGPWLGGIQPGGSSEPAGGWIWVTGEPFVYSRWAAGEPNNRFGTEDRIHFFGRAARTGDVWNDNAAGDAETFGYVVEYDRNLEPAPIFEFTFNEAGAAANSSGKDTNSAVLMQGSTPQDFHSADGEGVSGLPGDRAFDNRHSTGMGDVGSGGRAAMAADANSIDGLISLTIQGWFRTEAVSIDTLARLFDKDATASGFQVFGLNGNLRLGANELEVMSDTQPYAEIRQWMFFAIAYDGTRTNNNVRFYKGTRSSRVIQAEVKSLNAGAVIDSPVRAAIGNGNPDTNLSRPFDGWLDNIRVFGSKTDNSGALTLDQLEWFRNKDLQNLATPVKLTIRRTNNAVELSWPVYPGMLKLQTSVNLQSWNDVTQTPAVAGDRKVVTITNEAAAAFFRLR